MPRILLLKMIVMVACGLSVAACHGTSAGPKPAPAAPTAAAPVGAPPWVGVWKIDSAGSRQVADTVRYEDLGGGKWRVSNAGAAAYEFAIDGQEHPISEQRSVTWKALAPGQWEVALKIGGKVKETARLTLSSDAQSLEANAVGELPNGMPYQHKKRFVREGAGTGLVGTWRNVEMNTNDMDDGFIISQDAAGVVTWLIPTDNQSIHGRFDGSEIPLVGETARPGTTFSIRPLGSHQLAYTVKLRGVVDQYGTVTISSDGNTLSDESWPPGREGDKSTSVFRRYPCPPSSTAAPVAPAPSAKKDPDWLCRIERTPAAQR